MDNDCYLKNICCTKNCLIFQIWKKNCNFFELIIKQLLDSALVYDLKNYEVHTKAVLKRFFQISSLVFA